MNLSEVLKAAAGYYAVFLVLTLLLLPVLLPAAVWVLLTFLQALHAIGGGA